MGLNRKCLLFINDIIDLIPQIYPNKPAKMKCCLLGDLFIRFNAKKISKGYGLARQYFDSIGFETSVIDINGFHNSIPIDLCKPVRKDLLNKFDLIIDGGTGEHVENQYMFFKNVYSMLKKGGVVIHILPFENTYQGHGLWKYSVDFFKVFWAKEMYRLIDWRITSNKYIRINKNKIMFYCSLQKKKENIFIEEKEFVNPKKE